MNAAPASRKTWTAEEYLAFERAAAEKHQLDHGEIYAMAGASREHNLIVANLVRELGNALRKLPCEVYPSDLRVKVAATGLYTYPDVSVVCGPPEFDDAQRDTLLNPGVVFEVLSDSTERYDRGKKFEQYRALTSLREYALVSQTEPLIEHYVRRSAGEWLLREARAGAALALESLGVAIAVDEVYWKVLAPAASE